MDIESHLPTQEDKIAPKKTHFVAPAVEVAPDDGVLVYHAVVSIYDIVSAPDHSVLTFSPDHFNILNTLASNTRVFEIRLVELVGLPGAEYTAEFGKQTWNLEKSSYNTLIADLQSAATTAAVISASEETGFDREKARYTKKDGSVKDFDDFTIGSEDSEVDE